MNSVVDNSLVNQYKILHANSKNYGASSIAYFNEVCLCIDYLKPKVVLDYGCGKGRLFKALQEKYPNILFVGYDPSMPEFENLKIDKADFLINTDVLEHIPVEILPNVLKHIAKISKNCFFGLHHYAAGTILPNGENAHCTIKPPSWYHMLFDKYFSDIVALKVRSQFGSVVLTFKLPPHLIQKWNSMQTSIQPKKILGAITRVQSHLSYQLGSIMVKKSKSLFGLLKMPYLLIKCSLIHKIYQEIYKLNPNLALPPLESYADYKEALKEKECFTYKLGEAFIKGCKSWYRGGGLIFLFKELPRLKREFETKKD